MRASTQIPAAVLAALGRPAAGRRATQPGPPGHAPPPLSRARRRQPARDRGVRRGQGPARGLEAQERDLRGAIATTRALIDELGTLVAEQFKTTFRNLEVAFDARFKQLFGGGYARLELTDPEDLSTTGVEIVARPPGKKAQALAMLSGGERALTAVALLFAMLAVRPVPFCVLDEVDAALDEANIGRFADALRDLAGQIQFIVITHNRGTIEAADALYGVTVGDDSVSRVISLRLDEATALADGAASPMAAAAGFLRCSGDASPGDEEPPAGEAARSPAEGAVPRIESRADGSRSGRLRRSAGAWPTSVAARRSWLSLPAEVGPSDARPVAEAAPAGRARIRWRRCRRVPARRSLEAGVARSRGGFVARLRGLLGGRSGRRTVLGRGRRDADRRRRRRGAGDRDRRAGPCAATIRPATSPPSGPSWRRCSSPRDPDWRPLPASAGQPPSS